MEHPTTSPAADATKNCYPFDDHMTSSSFLSYKGCVVMFSALLLGPSDMYVLLNGVQALCITRPKQECDEHNLQALVNAQWPIAKADHTRLAIMLSCY